MSGETDGRTAVDTRLGESLEVVLGLARPRELSEAAVDGARPGDLPEIFRLLGTASLPLGGVEACVPTALVARLDGRIVGVAAIEPYGRMALLRSVAVDAPLRGSGLGTRLVHAAIARAAEAGIPDLYLLTETAEPFFAGLGWARITRDAIPDSVRGSVEFTELCPQTAAAMWLRIEGAPQ